MAIDIKISELNEISSNKTINQLIVNDRSNSSDPGTTRKISISNLLPTYDASDANKRAIVGNDQLISTAQSPGSESVNTNVIRDSAITTIKIAAAAVTGAKIANNTITNSNIASNTILGSNINNTTDITINNVAANNITASNVTASSNLQGNSLNITGGNTTINNKSYTWPNNYTGDRYLKVNGSGALSWEQPVAGTGTTFVYDDVLPVGAILPWASNSAPANYLICDGTYFDGTIYPGLSAVLSTTYGPFVSPKWYKLPDLRGKIPVGVGTNIPDLSGNLQTFTIGTSGGEYKHQLTIGELPAHTHTIDYRGDSSSTGSNIQAGSSSANSGTKTTSSIGSNESHNNIQPYVVTNYIIKAKPDPKVDFGLTIGVGLSANTATGNINLSGGTIQARVDNSTIVINGSNQISVNTSGLSISGSQLTGQQTGAAPIYGIRAWARITPYVGTDRTTAYKSGTCYRQIGVPSARIDIVNHGLKVNDKIRLDFTGANFTDGLYRVVSVESPDRFFINDGIIATLSTGTVIAQFVTVVASGNISTASFYDTGDERIVLNFITPMPNDNYATVGSGQYYPGAWNSYFVEDTLGATKLNTIYNVHIKYTESTRFGSVAVIC